jgi:outer membrane protein assembly factor BamB
VLRPYGGMAFVGQSGGDVIARGAVANAGEWTHFLANTQKNPNTGDMLVGTQVALQWFGAPGPAKQIDRDFKNTPPLWKDGVLVVPGMNYVTAVDAYNGALLWEREIPKSSRMPTFRDAGSYVAEADYLYVASDDKCLRFDLREGAEQSALSYPSFGGVKYAWAYLACVGDVLFGSVEDTTVVRDVSGGLSFEKNEIFVRNPPWPVSEHLFALNRHSGAELWRYTPTGVVINATIAIDNGKMFFVESPNATIRAAVQNRYPLSTLVGSSASLVALDITDGHELWRQSLAIQNITDLLYLTCPEGRVFLSGMYYGGDGNLACDAYAFNETNGSQLWKTTTGLGTTDIVHGAERGQPVAVNGVVYFLSGGVAFALDLTTGQKITWNFYRGGHGCGTMCASPSHFFCRGGDAVAVSVVQNQVKHLTTLSRPGCFINMIPAGGLINMPEASSGCTCPNFPIQTSMAFLTTLPLDAPTSTSGTRVSREAAAPPRLYMMRTSGALVLSAAGIPAGRRIKLSIVNLLGRKVLYKERAVSLGDVHSHTFVWECRMAGPGTYVVRLQAGDQHVEQSLTLIK